MSQKAHFIGIGGAGMAPVAELSLARGWQVSGSDARDSNAVQRLRALGAEVAVGHGADHVPADAEVVISSAIRADNPELSIARERGQPIRHRSEQLALVAQGQRFVAVAGAHGKTTTSGMLASALTAVGMDPSFAVGSTVIDVGASAHAGSGTAFVAEADESDGSFLNYVPSVAIVTNVEPDHLDHYGSAEAVVAAYREFVSQVSPDGLLVVCADDEGARSLISAARCRVESYGTGPAPQGVAEHWQIRDVETDGSTISAMVHGGGEAHGQRLRLSVAGEHNLANATAAWVAGIGLGADGADLAEALRGFTGTGRRFEFRGEQRGVRVVDDYAHHPTEVAATLRAARAVVGQGRISVLFQPHLYSRTRDHAAGFAEALAMADTVVVTAVYGAREQPIAGVDSELITRAMTAAGAPAMYVEDRIEAAQRVADGAREGDLVLTVGAGDVTEMAAVVLERLRGSV